MHWLRERRVALATLTLFTLLAGDFWRYSLTWVGWALIVGALLTGWITLAVRERVDLRRIPLALAGVLILVAASLFWSQYPSATAIGAPLTIATALGAVVMAHTVSLASVLRALGVALRWIIGLSLVFEIAVEALFGRPILPPWVSYDEPIPRAFYWSRALLFDGGRIQGIVGNANLLGTASLLALIVFSIQLAERRIGKAAGIGWISASVLTFILSGSGTVIAMTIAVLAVTALIVVARRVSGRSRVAVYSVFVIGTATFVALLLVFQERVLELLGRSPDLTFRLDIWRSVGELIAERPIAGWGWVSYWAPWVAPFDDLAVYRGVRYLQAHSAWLDVTLQLGAVGLTVFAALIVSTTLRAWSWGVDRAPGDLHGEKWLRVLPVLLMVALVTQSLAESRILIEAGWFLLVYVSVASRLYGNRVEHPRLFGARLSEQANSAGANGGR